MQALAIDQGTTSTRAIQVNDAGICTLVAAHQHRQIYPQPGWVEHDPEELITQIQNSLSAASASRAVGIANQGESCLAWHAKTKQAISNVIVWQDSRTLRATEKLTSDGAAGYVLERSGLPLDPYFSATKLAWIVSEIPQARALLKQGDLRLGTTDAFFLDRLTGNYVTDVTTASRTSLMNLQTGQWDAELCELFGVPIDVLPPIAPTMSYFGEVKVAGKYVPVTASVVDQQASLYGHGCRQPGDGKITFGTGAFALVLTGDTLCNTPYHGLLPTVAWQGVESSMVYALDGGVYSAGSAINWAKSLGLFEEFRQINHFDDLPAIDRGLVFVPALSGLGCPHWDRTAAGLWIGLSLDTSPLDMVQAVLEGIALRATEVLLAMADHVNTGATISIDGGLSKNPYFCQFLATLNQRDVLLQRTTELTALGTAMMASRDSIIPVKRSGLVYHPGTENASRQQRFTDAVNRCRQWSSDV